MMRSGPMVGSIWQQLVRRMQSLSRSRMFIPWLERAVVATAILVGLFTYYYLVRQNGSLDRLLTPVTVAFLLILNLVPVICLMVLVARRLALRRISEMPGDGRGRLHVRLVALFSFLSAVPTLFVAAFAAMLFQYGVDFWFSDKARTVLLNADQVATAYVAENRTRVGADIEAMAGDVAGYGRNFGIEDPNFAQGLAWQVAARNLSEAAVVSIGPDGARRLVAGANLDSRGLQERMPQAALVALRSGRPVSIHDAVDRVEAITVLDRSGMLFLYVSRAVDPAVLAQIARAKTALGDYHQLLGRARSLQLRFIAALLVLSLAIVGIAMFIAYRVADRVVRPVNALVDAARSVAEGDLNARVTHLNSRDEIGTLANAFNRMTRRLSEQTGALMRANALLDRRRELIEAVLTSVSAGVIALNEQREIRLVNRSALAMLARAEEGLIDARLEDAVPELDAVVVNDQRDAIVTMVVNEEPRTLAVKVGQTDTGAVLTFDDITQRLADQRTAAWSDVARRIAHEIKNPLTPIQLAAERLQRRYGRNMPEDDTVFAQLTSTIVRQVGDLRRMVDEFSSFARMPKPFFRQESIVDIVRQTTFLQEVGHPEINFSIDLPDTLPSMVCDRRQVSQALINIIKNAIEAIESRVQQQPGHQGTIEVTMIEEGEKLSVMVVDNGIGLPKERERMTEPYMTTRIGGTGLGLAIVRKIVEEHCGTLRFTDRLGQGAVVMMQFDTAALQRLHVEDDEETGVVHQDDDPLPSMNPRKRTDA
jgi:two-component system nitrogen regulation sensor histidine kinase NtrY